MTSGRSPVALLCLTFTACGSHGTKAKAWIGKTFLLDTPAIAETQWRSPQGMGTMLSAAPQFLLAVDGAGDDLSVTVATASQGVQDPCTPTTKAPFSGARYPSSTIAIPLFPMHAASNDPAHPGQASFSVHDLTFTDILPGLPSLDTAQLDGWVDMAELVSLILPGGNKELVCQASELMGASPCDVCPDSGEPYCRIFQAVQIGAGESGVPITGIDPSAVPASCR